MHLLPMRPTYDIDVLHSKPPVLVHSQRTVPTLVVLAHHTAPLLVEAGLSMYTESLGQVALRVHRFVFHAETTYLAGLLYCITKRTLIL